MKNNFVNYFTISMYLSIKHNKNTANRTTQVYFVRLALLIYYDKLISFLLSLSPLFIYL